MKRPLLLLAAALSPLSLATAETLAAPPVPPAQASADPSPPCGEGGGAGACLKVISAADAISQGTQVLDLRPKADWDKGHLPGAKQLSLADENFTEKVKAMFDPARPVLVYCRSGRCSGKAAKQLREAGFLHVDELEGGIEAWQIAGRSVER